MIATLVGFLPLTCKMIATLVGFPWPGSLGNMLVWEAQVVATLAL